MRVTKSIVLSRYNENIEWIKKYDNADLKIFVYNKGNGSLNISGNNIVFQNRPNLGRESETYLNHIIVNYDNLSDLTIFTQAHPFDNIPSFFDHVDYDLSLETDSNYFNWYGENYQTCDENGAPGIYPILSGHPNERGRTLKTMYEDVFGKSCPKEVIFKPNGSFCVSSDIILKNKKEIYENLNKFINYEEQINYEGIFKYNPYEGHAMERMWGLIFDIK